MTSPFENDPPYRAEHKHDALSFLHCICFDFVSADKNTFRIGDNVNEVATAEIVSEAVIPTR